MGTIKSRARESPRVVRRRAREKQHLAALMACRNGTTRSLARRLCAFSARRSATAERFVSSTTMHNDVYRSATFPIDARKKEVEPRWTQNASTKTIPPKRRGKQQHRSFASDAMRSASTEEKEGSTERMHQKRLLRTPKKKRCRRRVTGCTQKGKKRRRRADVHVSAPGVRFWIHRIDSTEAQAAARRARLREHVCRVVGEERIRRRHQLLAREEHDERRVVVSVYIFRDGSGDSRDGRGDVETHALVEAVETR